MSLAIKYRLANLLSYLGFKKKIKYFRWKTRVLAGIDYSKLLIITKSNQTILNLCS